MSQADKDEANHLTRQIQAYEVMVDEADSLEEAAKYEAEIDRLRAARNELIW